MSQKKIIFVLPFEKFLQKYKNRIRPDRADERAQRSSVTEVGFYTVTASKTTTPAPPPDKPCLWSHYFSICGIAILTKWFLMVSYVVSTTSSRPLWALWRVSSLVLPWKSPVLKCPQVSSSSFQLYITEPGLTIRKVPLSNPLTCF